MKPIHSILLVGIILCVAYLAWHRVPIEEGFDDQPAGLVFTQEQCALFVNQAKGMQASIDAAEAANQTATVSIYTKLLDTIQEKIHSTGCSGKEVATTPAPLALPTGMSSADVAAATVSEPPLTTTAA